MTMTHRVIESECRCINLDFAENEGEAWAQATSNDAGIMSSTAYMAALDGQQHFWPLRSSSLALQKSVLNITRVRENENDYEENETKSALTLPHDISAEPHHMFAARIPLENRLSASTELMRSALGGETVSKIEFDELFSTYRDLLSQHRNLLHRQQKIEQQLQANQAIAQHRHESLIARSDSTSQQGLYTLRYEDSHVAITRVTVSSEKRNNIKRVLVKIENLSMKLTRAELHSYLHRFKNSGRKAKERITAFRGLSKYRSTSRLPGPRGE